MIQRELALELASAPLGERAMPCRAHGTDALDDGLLAVWQSAYSDLARLVLAMGLDRHRADDALQDVYLAALRRPAPRLVGAELRRWLFRVAINRCRLEHRKRGRWLGVFTKLAGRGCEADPGPTAADNLDRRQEVDAVRRSLASLTPELKTPLVLRYFMELDSKEIGRILDLPDSTVRGQLRTARRKLALELKQLGIGNDTTTE